MSGKRWAYVRFLRGLRGFLNHPISYEQARETLRRRLQRREENFLDLMKRGVYGNPASPYLGLLRQAQCTHEDMVAGVRRLGLEAFLRQIRQAGVWVSLKEFKGIRPICRGPLEISARGEDFRNRAVSAGCEIGTGGSSGRLGRTQMDLEFLGERAAYDHLHFRMLDLYDVPLALWYPPLPAVTGVSNSLRYARIGHPPDRWFCLLSGGRSRFGLESRLATACIVWASRLSRCPLARPERADLDQIETVLDWVAENLRRRGRCALQSYVSQAVRLSLAAARGGLNLRGMQFLVDSEPLTPAKFREVESAGAKVFARYAATEIGLIATGCGRPREAGEYHLAHDGIAMIQDSPGPRPSPFFFTSLWRSAPSILLNVQMGDSGVADDRRCGCLMEEAGLTTHLRQVGSTQRATSEGMALDDRELVRMVEELLPAWYGGSSLDYQWVEEEDGSGLTRLWLRADERLGAIDEPQLVRRVLGEFARTPGGAVAAEMWRQAGTIRVAREKPRLSSTGKQAPLWRRPADPSSGEAAQETPPP